MADGRTLRGASRQALWLVLALLGALVFGALAVATADAQSAQGKGDKTQEYEVPVTQPESIVYDKKTNAFYGGSSGADGEVYKAKLKGAKLKKVKVFMETGQDGTGESDDRTQIQGFNADKEGRLYVAGGATGQLHVYKLPKGKKIAQFDTGGGGLINDVAIDPKNGDVYFTDSTRPFIFRVTEDQIKEGTGTPQAIALDDLTDDDDVDYTPSGRTNNPVEANGIRFTPGGEFIIFGSLNNGELYRLTPIEGDPADNPTVEPNEREIETITGITPAELGNQDGLEFLDSNTLYSVDNSGTMIETPGSFDESPERIVKLKLSDDYLTAEVLNATKNKEFRTPTGVSLAPKGRLLITNAEFFDTSEAGAPFFVVSIPRP